MQPANIETVTYGLASLAALGLAAVSRRRDALLLALMLCGSWALWNLMYFRGGLEWAAGMDAASLAVVMVSTSARPTGWKVWLAVLFVGQLGCHVLYWAHAIGWFAYSVALNTMFAGQLACVGWEGRDHARTYLRNRLLRPRHRHVGADRWRLARKGPR